jgi:hypothetical protein
LAGATALAAFVDLEKLIPEFENLKYNLHLVAIDSKQVHFNSSDQKFIPSFTFAFFIMVITNKKKSTFIPKGVFPQYFK